MIPSEEEAIALHRKYGSNEVVVRHCLTVARVALALTEGMRQAGRKVDERVVLAAALLHDIGRNRTQSVRHGFDGAEMMRAEGIDETVAQAIQRHVGAGLDPGETKELGLPDVDFIPRSLEERIVCFADKLVGSDRVRPFEVEVERFIRKGHDVERLKALKKGLQDELGQDPELLVLDNIKESQ